MNYEAWKVRRWQTPFSDIRSITMATLTDNNQVLEIVLEATREEARPRWAVRFKIYPVYRNIMESYRLKLWKHLDETGQRCGHTFTVEDSPWLVHFHDEEPLLAVSFPALEHFVITTEDDVVEVLSPEAPEVEFLGYAPEGAELPGKSDVFYKPEDGLTLRDILGKDN